MHFYDNTTYNLLYPVHAYAVASLDEFDPKWWMETQKVKVKSDKGARKRASVRMCMNHTPCCAQVYAQKKAEKRRGEDGMERRAERNKNQKQINKEKQEENKQEMNEYELLTAALIALIDSSSSPDPPPPSL